MRAKEFLPEVNIDNSKGWGATPLNANVDYRGMAVMMRPSTFLKLALPLAAHDKDTAAIEQHIGEGGSIGAPFLDIHAPDEWRENEDYSQPARVYGHDGRHRMLAIMRAEGDAPVEVHLFLMSKHSEWRNRHMTPEVMRALNAQLVPQGSNAAIPGPFFAS